jgi:hypothetical protein
VRVSRRVSHARSDVAVCELCTAEDLVVSQRRYDHAY